MGWRAIVSVSCDAPGCDQEITRLDHAGAPYEQPEGWTSVVAYPYQFGEAVIMMDADQAPRQDDAPEVQHKVYCPEHSAALGLLDEVSEPSP